MTIPLGIQRPDLLYGEKSQALCRAGTEKGVASQFELTDLILNNIRFRLHPQTFKALAHFFEPG